MVPLPEAAGPSMAMIIPSAQSLKAGFRNALLVFRRDPVETPAAWPPRLLRVKVAKMRGRLTNHRRPKKGEDEPDRRTEEDHPCRLSRLDARCIRLLRVDLCDQGQCEGIRRRSVVDRLHARPDAGDALHRGVQLRSPWRQMGTKASADAGHPRLFDRRRGRRLFAEPHRLPRVARAVRRGDGRRMGTRKLFGDAIDPATGSRGRLGHPATRLTQRAPARGDRLWSPVRAHLRRLHNRLGGLCSCSASCRPSYSAHPKAETLARPFRYERPSSTGHAFAIAAAWRAAEASIQAVKAATPSPVRAETINVCRFGLTRKALARHWPMSKSRCGRRSALLSSMRSAVTNMSGYLSGLSSPSVTESTTTLRASPRSKAAGQTRLPTFSMNSAPPDGRVNLSSARPIMCASR